MSKNVNQQQGDNTGLFEMTWAAYSQLKWIDKDPETGKDVLYKAIVPVVFEAGGESYVKLLRNDLKDGANVLPLCNRGKMFTISFIDGDKNAVEYNKSGKDQQLSVTFVLDDAEAVRVFGELEEAHVLGVLAMRHVIAGPDWALDDEWNDDLRVARKVRSSFHLENPIDKKLPKAESKRIRKLERKLPIRAHRPTEYPGKITMKITPNSLHLPGVGNNHPTDAEVKEGVFLEYNAAMQRRNVSLYRKDIVKFSHGFFKWGLLGAGVKSAMWRIFNGIVDVDVQKFKHDAEDLDAEELAEMMALNNDNPNNVKKRKADAITAEVTGQDPSKKPTLGVVHGSTQHPDAGEARALLEAEALAEYEQVKAKLAESQAKFAAIVKASEEKQAATKVEAEEMKKAEAALRVPLLDAPLLGEAYANSTEPFVQEARVIMAATQRMAQQEFNNQN